MRGRFITFEGGEGAGKSTQASLLVRRLKELALTVVLTLIYRGTRFGKVTSAVAENEIVAATDRFW